MATTQKTTPAAMRTGGNMIHMRANLEQAARFSTRLENKRAAVAALRLIAVGALTTRAQVDEYIKKALEAAKCQKSD